MVGKRILVTGASGFVGQHLLAALANQESRAEVVALGDPAKFSSASGTVVNVDVRTPALAEVVKDVRPDTIFHLAAKSSVAGAESAKVEANAVSVQGAINLADAVRCYAPAAMIIMASSGEVYGRSFVAGDRLTEDSAVLPANAYARGKLAAEIILTDRCGDDACVRIMRPLNHTGAGQDTRFISAAFAQQIARIEAGLAEPVVMVGNLDGERDFLDVRDVVAAYLAAASLEVRPGMTLFNVSSDRPRPLRHLLAELINLSGVEAQVSIEPSRWRANEIATTRLSSDRLRQATGWAPRSSWSDMLASVLNFYRESIR